MENVASSDLYDLLITRNFEPELLDSSGKPVTDPDNADLFSFDWKTDNHNYGTVVVLIGEDNELEIYFGDNLGRTMESDDKSEWYEFLDQLKSFAHRNLMTFEINNLNRLKYTMQGMAAIKEGLFENYYGNKKVSYSDQPKKTRLMIKHSHDLGEGDARYRGIDSLFIETAEGERFKLPFKNLMGGKVMARHVSEGGTPYDALGQHISEMVNELHTLSRFIRAARGRNLPDEAKSLAETAVRHYQDLKAKAKRMISQRGYHLERDSFDPSEFSESEVTTEAIRDMFIERSIDHRIEEALPLLARIKEDSMKEISEFENWTDQVVEGTWALPDSRETQQELKTLMQKPMPVGADATNATEQLYNLVGDDELYDRLEELAEQDPNADARPIVIKRLAELGIKVALPQTPTQPEPEATQEDIDADGIMMTRTTNCSSESVDHSLSRMKYLADI